MKTVTPHFIKCVKCENVNVVFPLKHVSKNVKPSFELDEKHCKILKNNIEKNIEFEDAFKNLDKKFITHSHVNVTSKFFQIEFTLYKCKKCGATLTLSL